MKKTMIFLAIVSMAYGCREKGGHKGNDAMYENVNEKHETVDHRDTTQPNDTIKVAPDSTHHNN